MISAPRTHRPGSQSHRPAITALVCSVGLFLASVSCEAADSPAATDAPTTTSAPAEAAKAKPIGVEAIDAFIAASKIDKGTDDRWKLSLAAPPKVEFDPAKSYFWILETNIGSIKVKLLTDVAPMHVSSTIYLTRLGFYDNISFHRVITGFMAQGGDPTGTGRGGPGYRYAGEFSDDALHDKPGVLSMANSGPGTDASQFFLTFRATPHLNGKHTVFGNVVEGMGTVKELESQGSRRGKPQVELYIERATISVE